MTAPTLAELKAERVELVAENEKCAQWGAAYGARLKRIAGLDRALAGKEHRE